MNTCGWILFVLAAANALIGTVCAFSGVNYEIKLTPPVGGMIATVGLCVLTWYAVH